MFFIEFFQNGKRIYDAIARKDSFLYESLISVFYREMNYLEARRSFSYFNEDIVLKVRNLCAQAPNFTRLNNSECMPDRIDVRYLC